jgi:hypothetical protein
MVAGQPAVKRFKDLKKSGEVQCKIRNNGTTNKPQLLRAMLKMYDQVKSCDDRLAK